MLNGTLTLVRGDDQNVGITVSNPDGSPYILSGATLVFAARRSFLWDSQIVLSKTVTGHLAPESGLSYIPFVSSDTININDQPHYMDLKLISSNSITTTLMNGNLFVVPATSFCPTS